MPVESATIHTTKEEELETMTTVEANIAAMLS